MLSFMLVRTSKLISAEDPFFSMTTQVREDTTNPIDLWKLGFMFAVEQVEPRIGRIEVNYQSWSKDSHVIDQSTPVKMVPCSQLAPGEPYEHKLNNKAFDVE